MKLAIACLSSFLLIGVSMPAAAQSGASSKAAAAERERARQRCLAARGTSCDTDQGLREWVGTDRNISAQQRRENTMRLNKAEVCSGADKATTPGCK